jgi:hypothetical protein
MNDAELAGQLSQAFREVASRPVADPPSLATLSSTVPVTLLTEHPHRSRPIMVGLLAAAAALIGAVVVRSQSGESRANRPDYSHLRHVALSFIPEGYGLVNAGNFNGDVNEIVSYQSGDHKLELFVARPGSVIFEEISDTTSSTFSARGLPVEVLTDSDPSSPWQYLSWTEHSELTVWMNIPPRVAGEPAFDENELRSLVEGVVLLDDDQWESALQSSGFESSGQRRRKVKALEMNGGPKEISMQLENSLQSGPVWFVTGESSNQGCGAAVVLDQLICEAPSYAFAFTKDRYATIEVDGVPASSTFAHPGYPDLYVIWTSASGARKLVMSGAS